jgi:hypothetical protein
MIISIPAFVSYNKQPDIFLLIILLHSCDFIFMFLLQSEEMTNVNKDIQLVIVWTIPITSDSHCAANAWLHI